jgi:hypothetical protein
MEPAVANVQVAIHHYASTIFRSFGIDPSTMKANVTVGVQRPERAAPRANQGRAAYGEVTLNVVKGGSMFTTRSRVGLR